MRTPSVLVSCLILVFAALLRPAPAEDAPPLDPDRVQAAVSKGLEWIRSRQKPDGSWDEGYISQFPIGPTALAVLTLCMAGERDVPAVAKAFPYMEKAVFRKTYDIGILLMAIEARYLPTPDEMASAKNPFKTLVRKRFEKKGAQDHALVSKAADWLLKHRHKPLWGYPMDATDWDHSNTQYALLGLGSASRLGYKLPAKDLFEVLDQILAGQEAKGPSVERFPVPAADHSMQDLDRLAKDLAELREEVRRGKPDGTIPRLHEFYGSAESAEMQARGWAYFPVGKTGQGGGTHPGRDIANLYKAEHSMTAASLAATILLKAMLEPEKAYKAKYREKVDRAIRDGAAYLARNWTLDHYEHPFYYLYGLERVGVLTGCRRFGEHDWYALGGEKILALQNADGSWGKDEPVANGGFNERANALVETCFAVLFLVKGTVPLLPDIPERPRTGEKR